MASGEIRLEGAEAYLVGQQDAGLKQMMEQVNLSRLSHGVRAAAMMRRCVNEALAAARGRTAFGQTVADFPLMRRQLMKLLVPAEQALSMALCTADAMGRGATAELRILTGLLKLRACRDNAVVATGSMEARGGNGYIEDWVNPRLIRDAQVGLLWEGTSNINALDVIGRAVGKSRAHLALQAMLRGRLEASPALPAQFRAALGSALDRAVALAERVANQGQETLARQAATALYDAASAILLGMGGIASQTPTRGGSCCRASSSHTGCRQPTRWRRRKRRGKRRRQPPCWAPGGSIWPASRRCWRNTPLAKLPREPFWSPCHRKCYVIT